MKHLTATILALAMLCAVSCTGNTNTPADTDATTTTVGSDAPIAPPETTETVTTAPEETVDIDTMLKGYTLHELSSDELESFRAGFPSDSALGKVAVKVTDYDGLYLLIEDVGVVDRNTYERAIVHRVICGDTVQDCNITFVFGPSSFGLLKTDEYTVVSHCWYFSYHYIFHKDGCVYIPADYGRDGASLWLSVEDGKLCYKQENPIITNTFGDYGKILDTVTTEDEWRYEWGTVSLEGDSVVLTKTKEQTMGDDNFLRDLFAYGSQFDTLEELLEYNRLKADVGETAAFLSTIPVYEYSYEDGKHLDEFDKIGAAEYAKYAAGEEFDEYFAIKFTEYPDIAIIGQVVTEPGLNSVYDQRVMDSVIRNGERHYLTENKNGPGFYAYVTEDFVCITMAASGLGGAFYAYDGGAEHHCRNSLSTNGQQTEPWDNNGDFSIQDLFESNGIMNYYLFGKNYEGAYQTGFRSIHNRYEGPDDMFLEQGTVQLIDGKITYVASETLTVAEWYKTQTGFHEESGCYTIEEFIEWLKTGAQWK